ncbi:Retroviral aspartyl protease [Popillia japonica]|uniref:Retroviral aspartyl protease n=1 Tax=Popillia japonica TaxID=7064 RepID=A0AAW1IDX6_POPJA
MCNDVCQDNTLPIVDVKDNTLPIVDVKVGNLCLKALFDTGSEVCLISKKVVDENHQYFSKRIIHTNVTEIRGSNGKVLSKSDSCICDSLYLNDISYDKFLVMTGLKYELILGSSQIRCSRGSTQEILLNGLNMNECMKNVEGDVSSDKDCNINKLEWKGMHLGIAPHSDTLGL